MKFYICPADEDMINATEEDDLFTGGDGNEYMYEVNFDGDTVAIRDTVGRVLPLDIDDIPAVCFMLNKLYNYHNNMIKMDNFLYDKLIQGCSGKNN